jgi:hypothetical protein
VHFALLGYVSGIFIFILLEQTNAKDKNQPWRCQAF